MSKFEQLFSLLDTWKTIRELQHELGWTQNMINNYANKLHSLGLIKKLFLKTNGNPCIFIRDCDEITQENLSILHNHKKVETEGMRLTRTEVVELQNQYLFGTKPVQIDNAKVVHLESDEYKGLYKATRKNNRPKSPKNYAGTSAGMVW
jgi:hypothetical protein